MQTSDIARFKSVQEDPRFGRWIEFLSAAILALAVIATAWCGYQAARWGGRQAVYFVEAIAAQQNAAQQGSRAYLVEALHIDLFVEWVSAISRGEDQLADHLLQRFPSELKTASEAWQALDPLENLSAPLSPMDMPEYILQERAGAEQYAATADEMFALAVEANQTSDNYVLLTVIFASVLFFGGISGKFHSRMIDLAMLILAFVLFIIGVVVLLTYPVY